MTQVQICIDIAEDVLHHLEAEAQREGIPVQSLLERMVNGLIRDMEREEDAGTDHPIIT